MVSRIESLAIEANFQYLVNQLKEQSGYQIRGIKTHYHISILFNNHPMLPPFGRCGGGSGGGELDHTYHMYMH
jgi:hypothetical protein